jgi:hypothetical protein
MPAIGLRAGPPGIGGASGRGFAGSAVALTRPQRRLSNHAGYGAVGIVKSLSGAGRTTGKRIGG